MRGPTLQKTTLVSLGLHMTLLVILIISYRHSHRLIIPPYYTVNLVNTDVAPLKTEGPKMDVIKNDTVPAAKPVVQKQEKTAKKWISNIKPAIHKEWNKKSLPSLQRKR
jgi:hypothetical protein